MNDSQELQSMAPVDNTITPYDRTHFKLYLQLLDAEQQNVDWQTAATDIMNLDTKETTAKSCWQSHLQRARWMSKSGFRRLLDSSE